MITTLPIVMSTVSLLLSGFVFYNRFYYNNIKSFSNEHTFKKIQSFEISLFLVNIGANSNFITDVRMKPDRNSGFTFNLLDISNKRCLTINKGEVRALVISVDRDKSEPLMMDNRKVTLEIEFSCVVFNKLKKKNISTAFYYYD